MDKVTRLYIEMETDLLLNIAKRLKLNAIKDVSDWQVERLSQLGGLTSENIDIVTKNSGKTRKEVEALFNEAIQEGIKQDQAELTKAISMGILQKPISEDYLIKSALKKGTTQTLATLNEVNRSMIQSASIEYTNIVNKITTRVISGTQDINSAVKQTITELSNNGLTGFTAKNGTEWSTEAYSRMIIKTNYTNTVHEVQNERIKASGGNYIEINSYAGARPLCSQDQGQIFALDNNTNPITDINGRTIYPRAWSSSTHGEPAGIFGINCGHSQFLFVPEISGYEPKTINKKENSNIYNESQIQRGLERDIRNAKREKQMLEVAKADKELIKEANNKLRDKQATMRSFIDKTDRTRDYSREFISPSK